jgi:RNA polymerase sigma-70 factor (ECF subfamily)
MCHELGHVVMYRPLKHRRWLTSEAAEGWAHYFGSRVVDDVWAAHGEKIWWMPYDYHAEGMDRLTTSLARGAGDDQTSVAAGMWMDLASIVGEKRMPAVFGAWEAAKIDATTPAASILAELKRASPGNEARLDAWWEKARPVLVFSVPRSTFAAPAPPTSKPTAKGPSELAVDDGKSAGKSSMAGSGHAVAFEAPGDGHVLTAVKIYGSRYGAAEAPAEDFHVYLCDEEGKQIADVPFPYKNFARGGQRWVTLKLPEPKAVPRHFILCVSFDPTATKGVYVHYDKEVNGDSRVGLPGKLNDAFEKGDWMIRAVVAPAK